MKSNTHFIRLLLKILDIFILLNFLLCGLNTGCKNKVTEPIDDTLKPGKRDYVWSIDSVDYGDLPSRIELESIWGSSAIDVWGTAGDASDVRDCLWHYDGIKWSRATAGTPITEYTGNKTIYAVWGSAKNDVWAFGRKIKWDTLSAFIMHYNGAVWTDVTPSNISSLKIILYNVYGVSKDNIWVGGDEYALNYNGNTWRVYKVSDSIIVNSITSNSKKIYMDTYSPWGNDSISLYSLSENNLHKFDYTLRSHRKFGSLLWSTETKLTSFADGVICANINIGGTIDTLSWWREFTTPTFFRNRFIQSINNVFAVGVWNLIYHYNGTDWRQIYISISNHNVDQHADYWGVWADGNEVFICDWLNGIIYHGR